MNTGTLVTDVEYIFSEVKSHIRNRNFKILSQIYFSVGFMLLVDVNLTKGF
jgi:hypothetical protein